MSCWYSNESTWIFILILALIIVIVSFAIKENLNLYKSVQQQPSNCRFTDYGYMPYSYEVTQLEEPTIIQQQQQTEISAPSIELFIPNVDEARFVQNYTRQPRVTQLQNINSVNGIGNTFTNEDYIPYNPDTRFQTPTYYVLQDRPNLANFIRE